VAKTAYQCALFVKKVLYYLQGNVATRLRCVWVGLYRWLCGKRTDMPYRVWR